MQSFGGPWIAIGSHLRTLTHKNFVQKEKYFQIVVQPAILYVSCKWQSRFSDKKYKGAFSNCRATCDSHCTARLPTVSLSPSTAPYLSRSSSPSDVPNIVPSSIPSPLPSRSPSSDPSLMPSSSSSGHLTNVEPLPAASPSLYPTPGCVDDLTIEWMIQNSFLVNGWESSEPKAVANSEKSKQRFRFAVLPMILNTASRRPLRDRPAKTWKGVRITYEEKRYCKWVAKRSDVRCEMHVKFGMIVKTACPSACNPSCALKDSTKNIRFQS